jgi:transcriptional regulator with XRE-family HTH domain
MSSQVLAKKLGVTFQQVQKYEKGRNRIAAAMLWEIAGILGHDITWFIEGMEGPEHRNGSNGGLSDDCIKLAFQVDRLPNDERTLIIKVIQACLDAFHATQVGRTQDLGAATLLG